MVAENDADFIGRGTENGQILMPCAITAFVRVASELGLSELATKLGQWRESGHDAICVPFHLAVAANNGAIFSREASTEVANAFKGGDIRPYLL